MTYHDPCHLVHAQRIVDAPRKLLGMVMGLEVVPLAESDMCCGAAGTYSMNQPAMAEKLGRRKVANIVATGAEELVTANVGCALQIARHLRETGAGDARCGMWWRCWRRRMGEGSGEGIAVAVGRGFGECGLLHIIGEGADNLHDVFGVDGFGDVHLKTGEHGLALVFLHGEGGESDGGKFFGRVSAGAELADEFEAVHLGHGDIADKHVGLHLGKQVDGHGRGMGGFDGGTGVFEEPAEHAEAIGFIINDRGVGCY